MKLTVKDLNPVYGAINEAKMGKMEAKDQVKFVKIARKLKQVIAPYQEFVKDAQEKFKGEKHDEYAKILQETDKEKYSHAEMVAASEYAKEYSEKLNECLKEEFEKEHDVEFEKLSEAAFEKLMESNEWTVSVAMQVQDIVAE